MRWATQRRLLRLCQAAFVAGLAIAVPWNLAALWWGLKPWWLGAVLPLPGLLGWLGLLSLSTLSGRATIDYPHSYRLLYQAPEGWADDRARQALVTFIQSGIGLDIIWAYDGPDLACWLAVSQHGSVLERLARDVFPQACLEAAVPPDIGAGVAILHWVGEPAHIPTPLELCQRDGIEGVYFRWRSTQAATVVLWGREARAVAAHLSGAEGWLPGQGRGMLSSSCRGDNPWPNLPPFPPSETYPSLAAVSPLERMSPVLRVNDYPALIIGQDAAAQPVGLTLPNLDGARLLRIAGQATEPVVIDLVQQAVQANRPVLLLDGRGVVTTRLARRLLRQVAAEQVLLCDVERPGQSRFRLNPLWLPANADERARALATGWLAWLREQGVTAAGLGLAASRHTQVAVILAALLSVERGLTLDVPGLREALLAPDFLKRVSPETWTGHSVLAEDIWAWWLTSGRLASSFDTHLRLAHLRDRLGGLLALPEYSVLWRGPYLDLSAAVAAGQSLFWRLPDPRRRLSPYLASQLLALHTLLTTWPASNPPLLLFLHEVPATAWVERLLVFPAARLVLSAEQPDANPTALQPTALLLSRLAGDLPPWLQAELPDIRPTDLRRLPPNRLVFKQGEELCTLDMRGD